jgi:DNA-binding NarL/FixJ family response regulator
MIRVLLVDDQPLLLAGFKLVLQTQPDLAVVGEAGNGSMAVAMAKVLLPDVVVMDVRMPVMDGIEATRRIAGAGLPARVLVLTTFDLDEYVFAALRAGASGFLLKDVPPADLLTGIRAVAAGPPAAPAPRNCCSRSPSGSGRCSSRWPAAAPTPRSRRRCRCRRLP